MNSTVSTKKLVINFIATTLKTVYLKVMFILSLADFNHFYTLIFSYLYDFQKNQTWKEKKKEPNTKKKRERKRVKWWLPGAEGRGLGDCEVYILANSR